MSVTDKIGSPIQTAQVGDQLSLRFEILDKPSPYEILVRELVAVDGVDSSEILLIDSQGCPTDASIMGSVSRVSGKLLEVPFDAFKFPSSDVVQFRTIVTPCVPYCEPITCVNSNTNPVTTSFYGRRKRSRAAFKNGPLDEVVVVGAIKITDTIEYFDKDGKPRAGRRDTELVEEKVVSESTGNCTDFLSLVFTCFIFLVAQLIVAWFYVYKIRVQRKLESSKMSSLHTMSPPPSVGHHYMNMNHCYRPSSISSYGH